MRTTDDVHGTRPVQDPVEQQHALAPRLETLSGKTLGLYSNLKVNATKLLEMIAEELARDSIFAVHRGEYLMWNLMEPAAWGEIDKSRRGSRDVPPQWLD